jgi:thiol-disulfide isomerase/thioredoxin
MKTKMNPMEFVEALSNSGWVRETNLDAQTTKISCVKLPHELEMLCSQYSTLTNPDETVWFYSKLDYDESSDSAFEWNFFEKNSLECVLNESQRVSVLDFWANHIPFCMSVADGYSYIAFRLSDGSIIFGNEPEYEESAIVIADSIGDFFELFISSIHGSTNQAQMIARFLGIH